MRQMRRTAAASAALALALVLSACGASGSGGGTGGPDGGRIIHEVNPYGGDFAAEGTPQSGGTLVMGTDREVISFDPTVQNSNRAGRAVYDSLMAITADGAVPYLAKSMDTSDGGTTWRMGLREGVQFSDGTPLDANAVIINVQRHIDKKSSPGHLYAQNIASMTAIDPLTVVFALKSPSGEFPVVFAAPFSGGALGVVISPAALQKYGDQIGANPVGAGPFTLTSWTRDSKMVLTKNPNYWQKGLPHLDSLEFRPLPDTETRYASIENGDVDLIFATYQTELLRGMQNPDLNVYYGTGHGAEWIYFNHEIPPFNDHRMREALVRGIDLDALAATQFRGEMIRADGFFGDSSAYQTPEAKAAWPTFDLEKAKALVADYVAGGGNATVQYKTTNAPNRVAFAEFLQAQMKAIGISLEVVFYDLAQYSSSVVQSQDFQIAGWVGGTVDTPYPAVVNLLHTGGNSNFGGYSDPKMDELLDKATASPDEAERTKIYQQVQLLANQDLAVAWYTRSYGSAIAKQDVKGVVRNVNGDMFFATTWLDR